MAGKSFSILMVALLSLVLLGSSGLALAAPDTPWEVGPSEDFYCIVGTGPACSGTASDNARLRLQSSLGTGTVVSIVRFPVTAPFQITSARLNLAYGYYGDTCQAQNVNVKVYSTTTDTYPSVRGSFLADVDGKVAQVPFPDPHRVSAAYNRWTSPGTTNGSALADYIESQRSGNGTGGDGVVSLWIETTEATGSIAFASSNGGLDASCGMGAGGAYLLAGPGLQLGGVDTPNAVTLTDVSARSASAWSLYGVLGLLALVTVGGVVISRRRAAAR